MRHFVLILMIALLPLRGWVGEAMAADMLVAAVAEAEVASKMIADHAHGSSSEATFHSEIPVEAAPIQHADCAGHEAATQTAPDRDSHCTTCTVCQTCNTVALSAPALSLAALALPQALPPAVLPRFASADRALSIKPPIS